MRAMHLTIVLAILLAACGDNVQPTLADLCAEQASAWCERIGYPTSGCERVYMNWCGPVGDRAITDDEQIACLEAIDGAPEPDVIPTACTRTWSPAR